MKKLRKLSLLLVLELGCMGAAMPGIVETEAADIIVNSFVLKTTGAENVDPKPVKVSSTSYSKHKIDIVEREGTHFSAAFIANGTSEVYEAGASIEKGIEVNVTKGGVTLNLYYTETGSSTVYLIDQSDRLIDYKTYKNGESLDSDFINGAQGKFMSMIPAGYVPSGLYDEAGNAIEGPMPITQDSLLTVRTSKKSNYATFDVLVQRDSGVESQRVAFDEIATVTSTAENFSYWAIGEKIVSYEPEYKFSVYSDTVIKEVCGEIVEKKPVVTLQRDNIADTGMANIYEVKYEIPAGFELVETGMIFGGTTLETATSKVVARRITSNNEYSVRSAADGAHRAYLIYRKDGKLNVIYDDGYGVEQIVFNHAKAEDETKLNDAGDAGSAGKAAYDSLIDSMVFSHSALELTSYTNVYLGTDSSTYKFGTSSSTGKITLTSNEKKFNKAVVGARNWQSAENGSYDSSSVSVNGTYVNLNNYISGKTIAFDNSNSVEISSRSKRINVNYIELYYADRELGPVTDIDSLFLSGSKIGVLNDIVLPKTYGGHPITWTSSNPSVIANDGKVTPPETGSVEVVLTAEVCGKTKNFTYTIKSEKEAVAAVEAALDGVVIPNNIPEETTKVTLYTYNSDFGVSVTWSADNAAAFSSKGVITHGEEEVIVNVTATYTIRGTKHTRTWKNIVIAKKAPAVVVQGEYTIDLSTCTASNTKNSGVAGSTVTCDGITYDAPYCYRVPGVAYVMMNKNANKCYIAGDMPKNAEYIKSVTVNYSSGTGVSSTVGLYIYDVNGAKVESSTGNTPVKGGSSTVSTLKTTGTKFKIVNEKSANVQVVSIVINFEPKAA